MSRLNSGNRNRLNFFVLAILTFQKAATDSGDNKILVQFPGSDFEILGAILQNEKKDGQMDGPFLLECPNMTVVGFLSVHFLFLLPSILERTHIIWRIWNNQLSLDIQDWSKPSKMDSI